MLCCVQDLASLQEAIATLGHRIEVRFESEKPLACAAAPLCWRTVEMLVAKPSMLNRLLDEKGRVDHKHSCKSFIQHCTGSSEGATWPEPVGVLAFCCFSKQEVAAHWWRSMPPVCHPTAMPAGARKQ